jgi:Flp pilus assembly pilin Flp
MGRGRAPETYDSGHRLTEHLIVVALVAIAVIGVVSLFGEQIEELFSGRAPQAEYRQAQAASPDGGAPPVAPSPP